MKPESVVLLVEDERDIRGFLRAAFTSHGFRLVEAERAQEGLSLAIATNPDIILLDLGLPDGDGLELTRRLRAWSTTPIIVISARRHEDDKVEALDAGADDYLTKPFGVNELLARVRVAMRRADGTSSGPPVVAVGPITIDLAKRQVTLADKQLHLTPIEYRLLAMLVKNRDRVVTHKQILKEVWGEDCASQFHYLRVHMAQLRRKIEVDPAQPKLITTEPGVGYRLRERSATQGS